MSASPLERIAPALAALSGESDAAGAQRAAATRGSFRPFLGVLTAFWIYVAISNVMYANNMQASLSQMKVEHVFALWDARIVQHLLLYPLFILSMRGSLRTGWQPLWRALPLQLLCALGFAVLASPALVLGEYLTSPLARRACDERGLAQGMGQLAGVCQPRGAASGSRASRASWSPTASGWH